MRRSYPYMMACLCAFGFFSIQYDAQADVEPGFFEEEFEEFIEEEALEDYVEEAYEEEPQITGCILDTEARVGVLCENWSARLTARLFTDALFVNSDSPVAGQGRGQFKPLSSGAGVRSARIGIAGTFYRHWTYKLDYDFRQRTTKRQNPNNDRGRITDAYIGYKGVRDFTFQVGIIKTPYDLTQANDSRFDVFMEGFFGDSFGITKPRYPAVQVSYRHRDKKTTAMVGAHLEQHDLDVAYDEGGDDVGIYGRITHAPYMEGNWYSHVGVGGKYLNQNGAATAQNFRSIAPFTQAFIDVDTDVLFNANNNHAIRTVGGVPTAPNSDSFYILSLEAAGGWKNYGGQMGYTRIGHDRAVGDDVGHHLFYIQGNWWLTGERNAYIAEQGVFGRVLPIRRLGAGGMGAVGLSLRYHLLNLDDSETPLANNVGFNEGGRLWGITAGVTWKINPYIKLIGEYVHVEQSNYACASIQGAGAPDATRCPSDLHHRGVQLRAQMDF
ncbi:MAG: hypothetical protein GDA54_06830 [Alphaproteobacteria bacterium GM7ARS4]|nr:hypothetical protein [Alphaproteobacteria bacterium GM7ARS4]